jgi:hypothetical protein
MTVFLQSGPDQELYFHNTFRATGDVLSGESQNDMGINN